MTDDQLVKLQKTVADSIEKNVNGKIRLLDLKLDSYIQDDLEWKKSAQPALDTVNDARSFGRVFMKFVGVVAAIGGVYLMVVSIFKK